MIRRLTIILAAAALTPCGLAETATPRMLKRVQEADANRDGAVTRAEFAAYRRAQFARMDRDGDGFITQGDIAKIRMFMPRELEPDTMIARFDTNGDGRIDPDELADGPAPVFDLADTDSDGVVSPAEFAAADAKLKAAKATRR
jgi:Ca2+-binding EF-hand superfamily protein